MNRKDDEFYKRSCIRGRQLLGSSVLFLLGIFFAAANVHPLTTIVGIIGALLGGWIFYHVLESSMDDHPL